MSDPAIDEARATIDLSRRAWHARRVMSERRRRTGWRQVFAPRPSDGGRTIEVCDPDAVVLAILIGPNRRFA